MKFAIVFEWWRGRGFKDWEGFKDVLPEDRREEIERKGRLVWSVEGTIESKMLRILCPMITKQREIIFQMATPSHELFHPLHSYNNLHLIALNLNPIPKNIPMK